MFSSMHDLLRAGSGGTIFASEVSCPSTTETRRLLAIPRTAPENLLERTARYKYRPGGLLRKACRGVGLPGFGLAGVTCCPRNDVTAMIGSVSEGPVTQTERQRLGFVTRKDVFQTASFLHFREGSSRGWRVRLEREGSF